MHKTFFLLLLVFCFCPAVYASMQIDGVAALVNNHVITVSDVLGSSSTLQQQLSGGRGGAEANALFAEILKELIERKLITDSYEQQRELQIPAMAVDARVQEIIQDMFRDDRNAFLRALGEEGRSERSWREDIRQQLVVRSMRNLRVDRHVRISPTEIRAWYDAHPENFVRDAEVTYRMLVVSNDPVDGDETSVSNEILVALEAGRDFAAVTQEFSIDQFAERGGLRGPVGPDQLREEVWTALAALDVGGVAGPITLGNNKIWLQLESLVDAEKTPFKDAYDEIYLTLFRKRATEKYNRWMSRLRADAFISVKVEEPF